MSSNWIMNTSDWEILNYIRCVRYHLKADTNYKYIRLQQIFTSHSKYCADKMNEEKTRTSKMGRTFFFLFISSVYKIAAQ